MSTSTRPSWLEWISWKLADTALLKYAAPAPRQQWLVSEQIISQNSTSQHLTQFLLAASLWRWDSRKHIWWCSRRCIGWSLFGRLSIPSICVQCFNSLLIHGFTGFRHHAQHIPQQKLVQLGVPTPYNQHHAGKCLCLQTEHHRTMRLNSQITCNSSIFLVWSTGRHSPFNISHA